MSEYVDKAKIYEYLSELEDRERTAFLGMAWDNPMKTKSIDRLTIYTELKHRLADMPSEKVITVKECCSMLDKLIKQMSLRFERVKRYYYYSDARDKVGGYKEAILQLGLEIDYLKKKLRGKE